MTYTSYCPEPGHFDPSTVILDDSVLGLDTEYTATGLYQAGSQLRLVQFATLDFALVLDLTDDTQRRYAHDVLSDSTRTFVAHNASGAEVPAIFNTFGIDISHRVIDTLVLGLLLDPRTSD